MHSRFSYLPWMSETAGPGLAAPSGGSRPRAPGRGALPSAGHAAGAGRSGAAPAAPLGRAARTHPCALREVVAAERVVQVEAHHVALSQGKVLLHRRTAAAAGGRRRSRRRKRREEEGARAALPAEPSRAERSGARGDSLGPLRPPRRGHPHLRHSPWRARDGGAGAGRTAGGVSKRSNSKSMLPAAALCAWEPAWDRGAPARLADRERELRGVCAGTWCAGSRRGTGVSLG